MPFALFLQRAVFAVIRAWPNQDLLNLAPKKPNWDLNRDLARKLAPLEKVTKRAIAELIRMLVLASYACVGPASTDPPLPCVLNMTPLRRAHLVRVGQRRSAGCDNGRAAGAYGRRRIRLGSHAIDNPSNC